MAMNLPDLIAQTLLLDLETTRTGKIRHIGAVYNGQVFEKKQNAGSKTVLEALDQFAQPASYVLGHNLLGHDFPLLKVSAPWLKLLTKPVIDTLYLSPLAFPENPYHRLVKDYKLVRTAINSPLADAELAASVFADQWESFETLAKKKPALLSFFHFCFRESLFNGFKGDGMSAVFSSFSGDVLQGPKEALACFLENTDGKLCVNAAEQIVPYLLDDVERRPATAYCLAWLQVAGGNSVLPPWVRHRFPEIPTIIKALREAPCGQANCAYCLENHDPERQLERFFGYHAFRGEPCTPEGESLQRAIVLGCLADQPVMGILPTGGGKSLCYQLPALVRYWRRGTLTVVISPLQALMKDQVDNLVKKTGTLFAGVISGLQTAPERGEVYERIRLGDTAILYISPEQLRNTGVCNVLKQREIGCWVFDEAHCLSKWGHDFRPDYLYAARFIKEFAKEQDQPVPPIGCFTATAKISVIEEIQNHFREELGSGLQLFSGSVERNNLRFEVIPITAAEKLEQTHELIVSHLHEHSEPGGVIVYAATKKSTEEIQEFLQHQGVLAAVFHGGLDPRDKREIIEQFVAGDVPVICATNAFGMGIDKENIRLVLHYNMPGSLENYIQEAGRAGRDLEPARCVLLYDPQDANLQFSMGAMSEVKRKDIARILRALRRKKKNAYGEIVVTSDELLREEDWVEMQALRPEYRDTKIRAAIAWLERAGFLERNHNQAEVFQGKPLVESLEEAAAVMDRLNLSPENRDLWLCLLQQLINRQEGKGVRADELAEALFPEKERLLAMEQKSGRTAAQIVIQILHDMATSGLIDQGVMLSATFRPKGKNNALKTLESACEIENKLVNLLMELDPDAEQGSVVDLDVRRLNQKLINGGLITSPDHLRRLIKGISYDGKGLAASQGSFEIVHVDRNRYRVSLKRSWKTIRDTIFLRQSVAHLILSTLIERAKKKASESGSELSGDVQLSFTSDELAATIKADLVLSIKVKKPLPAIDRALMFLHEQHAIELQGGLAVLRQAMTIRLSNTGKGRYYSQGNYRPLEVHYREKRFQVHVMMRYATLALDKVARALALVLDYFRLGRIKFIKKYFDGEEELIEKATTAESYRTIVENLRNPVQIEVVSKPVEDSMLILAGPGSGKTTVIVHRCAYLLEVERIPGRQILVLCFNHSSAMLLKKRLRALVGKAASGVTVATYHGVAMRLAGISIRDMADAHHKDHIDFDGIIKDAVKLLKGEKDLPGVEADEQRDRLLAGYSHILVDEYQDIDADQYDLVSAIAGRTLEEKDARLAILAVGDDDQNIYTFRGANVQFIRRFQEDYSKDVTYLVENYRSSKHIIAASNALIKFNRDRMKGLHPICIDRARQPNLPGGRWEHIDPVSKGRVQIVSVRDMFHQAIYVKKEIDRLRMIDPKTDWQDIAVLSRTKGPLAAIRSVLESEGYPIKVTLDTGLPLHRVREFRTALGWLEGREKQNARASDLKKDLIMLRDGAEPNIWWNMVDLFFDHYCDTTGDSLLPVSRAIEQMYEFVTEQRREKAIGQGIFLSTIHSAKGTEFPHVFILDGDWGTPMRQSEWEEERRVFYVGMTRAEETLRVIKIPSRPNPFLKEIKGDFIIPLIYRDSANIGEQRKRRYEILGLDQLYLDYAGRYAKSNPIHHHLRGLQTGHSVVFCPNHSKLEIHDTEGKYIACLSNEGANNWKERIDRIIDIRVLAILQRTRDDPDEGFQQWIKVDEWELPVLEVIERI
jgi:ATP-dependent DNA helicase RecQ